MSREHSQPSRPLGNNTQTSLRAVIYLRVSTKEQAQTGGEREGFSIPAQREACRRKAEGLGAAVIEEFVDRGESAKSANRPELQRLLKFVTQESVDYVIVHKVDRLARNRFDDVTINVELGRAGVTLVSVTENIDETPSGVLLHGIMSSIAEFYSRNLANEVMKGMLQKVRSGGTVGKAPLGYLNVRRIENGREVRTIDVDPEQSVLMRRAFELYATGAWTLRGLLKELTSQGLRRAPGPKTPSKPVSLSHFNELLRNPYYLGVVTYQGVQYPGKHPPLISHELFERVQLVLTANDAVNGTKKRKHNHYLKGMLYCSCGSRLGVEYSRGNGGVYGYYFCLGRQAKRTACKRRAMRIELIENEVERHYATVRLAPEHREAIEGFMREHINERRRFVEADVVRQQARRQELLTERDKLLQAHYADAIPIELLRSEQDRISKELVQVELRLASYEVQSETIQANLVMALELADDCQRAYKEGSPVVRRLLNAAFFERLLVDEDGQVSSTLAAPYRLLLGNGLKQAIEKEESERKSGKVLYLRRSQPMWAGQARSPVLSGLGSNYDLLVEAVVHEPVPTRGVEI